MATTRHVKYDDYENKRIVLKAARVGLPVTAYIKQMSLEGSARGYKMEPVVAHTAEIGRFVVAVKDLAAELSDECSLHERELDQLAEIVTAVLESEKNFLKLMIRKMRG